MHSKPNEPRTAQDAFTSLRSGLLNPNGLARSVLLWCFTLLVWLPGLGTLPLRDWDEGRVASVARSTMARLDLSQANLDWLLAWKWHEAYLNKPPGLHWFIGSSARLLGEQEWAVRLLPCLIASLAIPLLYVLRRQLGGPHAERKALLASLTLMTLLPMARHGRLAMLDGSLVTSMLLLWTGWLSSRTRPWHGLLAGLGITGVLMLKPPAVLGFLLITAAISAIDRRQSHWRRSAMAWVCNSASRRMTVVVLPVPGPPVITAKGARAPSAQASFWEAAWSARGSEGGNSVSSTGRRRAASPSAVG